MNRYCCTILIARLQQQNPQPTTELSYNSPFQLLISVILSARTTDKSVNKATEQLYRVAPGPKEMLLLGVEGIKHHIKSIGLYTTKAKNIIKTCELLLTQHNGNIPACRNSLESLPGVGRKTANVVLNILFGWPTIAVDTHVFRVSNRTGLACGKTVGQVEQQLNRLIPKRFKLYCHRWLVLHGRYTCLPRNPRCQQCIIADLCQSYNKTLSID